MKFDYYFALNLSTQVVVIDFVENKLTALQKKFQGNYHDRTVVMGIKTDSIFICIFLRFETKKLLLNDKSPLKKLIKSRSARNNKQKLNSFLFSCACD